MQVVMVRELNMYIFPPNIYSNYASHIFLMETLEISHFYIIIKSMAGMEFDVLWRGTWKWTPTLLFMIETL